MIPPNIPGVFQKVLGLHQGVEYGHIIMMSIRRWGETPPFQKDRALSHTTNYTTTYEQQIIYTSHPLPHYHYIYNIQDFLRVYAQASRSVSPGTATTLKCSWAWLCWSWCICKESYHLMQTFHIFPYLYIWHHSSSRALEYCSNPSSS